MFERQNSKAAKLSPDDVRLIRQYYSEGATQGQLCRHFGVSVGQIGRIVRGESWAGKAADGMKTEAEAARSLAQLTTRLADVGVAAAPRAMSAPPPSPLEGADAPAETEGASLSKLNERAAAYGLDIDRLRGAV